MGPFVPLRAGLSARSCAPLGPTPEARAATRRARPVECPATEAEVRRGRWFLLRRCSLCRASPRWTPLAPGDCRSPDPLRPDPGSKPRPSSSISRIAPSGPWRSDTRQVVASACRLTFERASRVIWTTSGAIKASSAATTGSTSTTVNTSERSWNSAASSRSAWSNWRSIRIPGRRPKM